MSDLQGRHVPNPKHLMVIHALASIRACLVLAMRLLFYLDVRVEVVAAEGKVAGSTAGRCAATRE